MIHVFALVKAWMAGTSPAMTGYVSRASCHDAPGSLVISVFSAVILALMSRSIRFLSSAMTSSSAAVMAGGGGAAGESAARARPARRCRSIA